MTWTETHPFSFRFGAGLFLTAVLVLTGCSEPGSGKGPSPRPTVPSASATEESTPESDSTATVDPSETKEPMPASENTATGGPVATKGPPPASTPVPPPTPGSINETVESRPMQTKAPGSLKETATFDREVSAQIVEIKKIEDPSAGMPDEMPGPALAITVKLTNGTSNAVPLDSVVVEVLDSAEAPGGRMTGDPYAPLSGSLAAGKSASGTYVYTVAKDRRDPISVVVTLNADDPMVLFRGPVR